MTTATRVFAALVCALVLVSCTGPASKGLAAGIGADDQRTEAAYRYWTVDNVGGCDSIRVVQEIVYLLTPVRDPVADTVVGYTSERIRQSNDTTFYCADIPGG